MTEEEPPGWIALGAALAVKAVPAFVLHAANNGFTEIAASLMTS